MHAINQCCTYISVLYYIINPDWSEFEYIVYICANFRYMPNCPVKQ